MEGLAGAEAVGEGVDDDGVGSGGGGTGGDRARDDAVAAQGEARREALGGEGDRRPVGGKGHQRDGDGVADGIDLVAGIDQGGRPQQGGDGPVERGAGRERRTIRGGGCSPDGHGEAPVVAPNTPVMRPFASMLRLGGKPKAVKEEVWPAGMVVVVI